MKFLIYGISIMAKLVGPRMQSGKFTKNTKKRSGKGLNKTEKKEVLALVKSAPELKYCTDASAQVQNIITAPNASTYPAVQGSFVANTPAALWSIVPRMARADDGGVPNLGASTRVGNRVEPVKITTELNFHYNDNDCPLKQGFSYVMKYWVVSMKTVKNFRQSQSAPVNSFLRQGDAPDTTYDWNGTIAADTWIFNSNKMVNNQLFTVHKTGELRIRKSIGDQGFVGSALSVPATNSASIYSSKMRYTYKPPKLVYGEGATDIYPDNHARYILTVVYDETGANFAACPAWIRYSINNQMWFKDA